MTRREHENPPAPRTTRAARQARRRPPRRRRRAPAFAAAALAAALGLTAVALAPPRPASASPSPAPAGKRDGLPEGVLTDVQVEGNATITAEQVRAKLLCKKGSPLDARLIDADVKSLLATKWFSSVQPEYAPDPKDPSKKGFVLVFVVREAPVIQSVEFRGMTKLKLKDVESNTGLKKGARADATRTALAVGQIKRLYEEKGYDLAEVKLLEGGKVGDTKVVIGVYEGPEFHVASIDFKGNVFSTDSTLRTKITSRTRLLGLLGGKYHRDNLDEDCRKLKEYYQAQGFYEVQVAPVTRSNPANGDVNIEFDIAEGTRYRVRNITFEGNKKLTSQRLREGLMLHSGQPILDALKETDRKNLVAKYQALGCIDTQILPEPKYTNEPGVVDIVYRIEEGEPFLVGDLTFRGNERTKDKVLRREFAMAGILPGEPLDANRIDLAKKRLGGTQYFVMSPETGKALHVEIENKRPANEPYGNAAPVPDLNKLGLTRMQNPEPPLTPPIEVQVPVIPGPGSLGNGNGAGAGLAPSLGPAPAPAAASPSITPFGSASPFSPPPDTPPIEVPVPTAPPAPSGPVVVPPGGRRGTPPVGTGEPPGMFPSIPGMNANDVGPDRQDPFPGRGYADIVTSVEEAPTGRFMLGVGASSYQGLMGNLTIIERNFDLLNVPRSFNDLVGGNAFRGAGQQFQLDLMPGTLINRFQVSLKEPYLFDLPIGASGAGYIFNRIYPDWTESRGGGRFSLGRQFGTQTYADLAFRIEEVDFYGYTHPAPADYLAASGHSTLATLRPSIRFDNRNAPFMPNKGQYLEFSYEQGWGTFTYPKFEAEGRTYFTTGSRPDGSGKRILTFRGHFGIAGRDTPVYERFFAGNFGSLRGFQYRGVGQHVFGKNVGGIIEGLGSVEYQWPWLANDMLHQVVFCDFGTVNSDYNFQNFRVSVGTGLRLIIPAMGPLPLCFDLAFPVEKANGDRVQYFNFTIGAFY